MQGISPELRGAGGRVTLTRGYRGPRCEHLCPRRSPRGSWGTELQGTAGRQAVCALWRVLEVCTTAQSVQVCSICVHSHGSPSTGNSPAGSCPGNLFRVCLLICSSRASCLGFLLTVSQLLLAPRCRCVCSIPGKLPEVSPSRQVWVRLNLPVGCVR